ncbi:MAG: sigma-70 family RNA polymerase sigma factor [Candidatus Poribacteria bacterium]|nr:sigma-70 family RNA polymerase sigma factor [Candidatus Poribacteria bacterium]
MKNDDVKLIQLVLAGDESAFAELVKKYQKPVHALAWRKIGDFHIAEEITQDTFLKVYQRLHTLKDANQFSGWLYVIATRRCYAWLRKKRIRTQPLEDAETTMIQRDAYSRHVAEERVKTAVESQREVVKRLLAKLKESERTVMTLHYLGEMTVEEISRFLGVSAGTIKSRLQRARNRLKKEETMIKEALDYFQLSPNLTDNIMQEVSRLKPTPSVSNPFVPWAIAATSAILIVFMLGIGSQQLLRFQQPYTLDAQTEMTVELVDTPIVLNLEATPDIRRELGSSNALGESDNNGQKPDEILFTAAQAEGEDMSNQKQQWIQAKQVSGAPANNLHTTPDGDLYVIMSYISVYKLATGKNTWQRIHIDKFTSFGGGASISKWNNTLYFLPNNELLTSNDDGETWNLLYSWKKGRYKLVLTKQAFYVTSGSDVLQSQDKGKTWKNISEGLMGRIKSLFEIQNTIFAGTNNGCYRYSGDGWKRLKFPVTIGDVISTAATDRKLYVAARLDSKVSQKLKRTWGIFRSTDLGDSWQDITPTNAWHINVDFLSIKLIAIGDTLLAMGQGMVRSIDGGDTWLSPQAHNTSPTMGGGSPVAIVKKDTIYISSENGLHYSTDLGESWHKMNIKQEEENIYDLIAFKKTDKDQSTPAALYARMELATGYRDQIQKTDDGGNSWKPVQIAIPMTEPNSETPPHITQIIKHDNVLYAKGKENVYPSYYTRIYRLSSDGRTLVQIQGMPAFNSLNLEVLMSEGRALGATQFLKLFTQPKSKLRSDLTERGLHGAFAVTDDTFYVEYNYKLFRWQQGDTEWHDTGIEETVELTLDIAKRKLKLAVSGNTVYVGKRDGHLVVSFDKGNNWVDLTPALPFHVNSFNDIVLAGSTVYVATDAGIITSDDGRHWHTVTDAEGTNLVMERLTADGTMLYGVTKDTGIYRLESGTWEQVVSEIPDNVISLAVDGNTLYVGTQSSGMLHFTLEE